METQWLTFAKRLQALASTGLHFSGLVSDFAKGYATPKVDVRGAIVEGDAILLVRERSDGLWTLPGGFADVGYSAAQNIEKEIWEEAGLCVSAHRLYGVRHKARQPYAPDARDFYKMFFLCERMDASSPQAGNETSEVGFFRLDDLPALSTGRVIESDIQAAFAFASDAHRPAFFD